MHTRVGSGGRSGPGDTPSQLCLPPPSCSRGREGHFLTETHTHTHTLHITPHTSHNTRIHTTHIPPHSTHITQHTCIYHAHPNHTHRTPPSTHNTTHTYTTCTHIVLIPNTHTTHIYITHTIHTHIHHTRIYVPCTLSHTHTATPAAAPPAQLRLAARWQTSMEGSRLSLDSRRVAATTMGLCRKVPA